MTLVVFAWGNPSRGDDAVGPWFADRYRDRAGCGFTLVEDFQLQVEHILDCQQADMLLFIDAHEASKDRDGGAADKSGDSYQFQQIHPSHQLSHTSHALSPAELLGQYQRVFEQPPPRAFQLSIAGTDFELGAAMSAPTQAGCEQASILLDQLLQNPIPDFWKTATV